MELRDWVCYPHQVDAKVAEWRERFPNLLEAEAMEQYTRHKVWALTVTDRSVPTEAKRKHLFFVPHAHEPAGTVGCMNAVCQLLTGKHLDGCPSTLMRDLVLQKTVLTFIPDGNPDGRSRAPEPYWEGQRYNNTEFTCLMFGNSTMYWETFKRVSRWSARDSVPARLGIVYEQISEHEYVEPNRGDPDCTLVKLVNRLQARYGYDQVLNLHQTEFEHFEGGENCFAILPHQQDELPKELQERNVEWAQQLVDAWKAVGGNPIPAHGRGGSRQVHRQSPYVAWADLERSSSLLTIEIQNNSPKTPHEMQLLLVDAAIWCSVERLMP